MEKIVHKFASFAEADEADEARHRRLTGQQKLQILLDLIMPENPHEAVIERSASVYPLGRDKGIADARLLERPRNSEPRMDDSDSANGLSA
jgi:hypothetical protein